MFWLTDYDDLDSIVAWLVITMDVWFIYDDIILLSHSVNAMRIMLTICGQFAMDFDMKFNA